MVEFDKSIFGLIINPISGMGGSVGLKGTDGRKILMKAIELGAIPTANNRTRTLLNELKSIKTNLKFVTCPGSMGENILNEMNFEYVCVKHPAFSRIKNILDTTSRHTEIAAEIMKKSKKLKLIIFVGGDGTARDILKVVGNEKPCLGIPAGVKIFSSVFSINPKAASSIIIQFLCGEIFLRESEVLDINENEYRKGNLISKLYGYLLIPYTPEFYQTSKIGSPTSDLDNQERIAKRIIEILEKDIYYLLGPGTTVKAITDQLYQKKTLLGIDLLLNEKVIAQDLNEQQILKILEERKVKIIISLIGQQGFLFGRGNLQISPKVLKAISLKDLIIVATKFKLQTIANQILRIDTRDPELDEKMKGLYKIIVDYDELKICKLK
ncbi:MAG: ATP-NAD kinase family protein [Candidatus Hermodarchaeota archaeon]